MGRPGLRLVLGFLFSSVPELLQRFELRFPGEPI
jgi:hypothetical protein